MLSPVLFGYLVADPIQSGKATLCRIRCRDRRGDKKTIGFAAYGKTGELIMKHGREGKWMACETDLNPYSVDTEDGKKFEIKVVVVRIDLGPDSTWADEKRGNNYKDAQLEVVDAEVEVEYPEEVEEADAQ